MNFTGNETGSSTNQPLGTVSFDYNIEHINTLLGRPGALGVRFHFNRPRSENPTELFAAACGVNKDILDTDNIANNDYFKTDGVAVSASSIPAIITSTQNPKAGACVFFSRTILEGYIRNAALTKIRLFVVGFGPQVPGVVPNLSLVSAGVNSSGQAVEPFLLSEQPCPPNCPVGYP